MRIIGIDPGVTGAIAVIEHDRTILGIYDMPNSLPELAELINKFSADDRACIEQPFTNTQGDADKELAKLVRKLPLLANYNQIIGMLVSNRVPVQSVAPKTWQACFSVRGKSAGNDSINQCLKVYGEDITNKLLVGRKRMHGRSDALLIAEWKRLQILEQLKKVA